MRCRPGIVTDARVRDTHAQPRSRDANASECAVPPRREKSAPNKKGRRSAERRMPTMSAQQRRMSPFADAFRAAARLSFPPPPLAGEGRGGGRARLPALHRGTRQRLSPRWLSPRTGFPQSTAKRVFCPLAAKRFELSTLRADRSFCRPTGAPGPPGSGSHPSARGHRIPLRFPKVPSRKAPLVSLGFVLCIRYGDLCQCHRHGFRVWHDKCLQ